MGFWILSAKRRESVWIGIKNSGVKRRIKAGQPLLFEIVMNCGFGVQALLLSGILSGGFLCISEFELEE